MTTESANPRAGFSRFVAVAVGAGMALAGAWAMLGPESFFARAALFEPYNQHFVQDIGAFQIGLGAVLILAAFSHRLEALTVALLGVGAGATLHVVSHIVGRELGGRPLVDIPVFGVMAGLLVAAGVASRRR